VSVKRVNVCLVDALLADGLKLELRHHVDEEVLVEVYVVLIMFLYDLHPLDRVIVWHPVVLYE
jgi:hypothetical protein